MSRKTEIRTRIGELHKEFAGLNAEMKEIDENEKRAVARDKYKDFLYKVGTYGYKLLEEDKIEDVTDEDRETAQAGLASGLVYTGVNSHDGFGYVLLKEKTEYNRVVRMFKLLAAASNVLDEKVKDKEKYLRILLGETDEQTDSDVAVN